MNFKRGNFPPSFRRHSDKDLFIWLLSDARDAIDDGIHPILAKKRSGGCYICRNSKEQAVAIFKPRDEETCASNNPNLQTRIFAVVCPCLFGPHYLRRNQAYLAEVGACVVDGHFRLGVVPETQIVRLRSPKFHYALNRDPKKLPFKVGSFQLFVREAMDFSSFVNEGHFDSMDLETRANFRLEFEKMVVLDFIIQNVDRASANWLVRIHDKKVSIAAIDNGLSFPYRFPTTREPPSWLCRDFAKTPFSDDTKRLVADALVDVFGVESLVRELERLFRVDTHFDQELFNSQMSLLRGQIVILWHALLLDFSPYYLMQRSFNLRLDGETFRRTDAGRNGDYAKLNLQRIYSP